jgi:hypothetical protein
VTFTWWIRFVSRVAKQPKMESTVPLAGRAATSSMVLKGTQLLCRIKNKIRLPLPLFDQWPSAACPLGPPMLGRNTLISSRCATPILHDDLDFR